jgi:hypothetical protein
MLDRMKESESWRLLCAPGGWARVTRPADQTTVYMRLRGTGEGPRQRLNVHSVVMESDSPISTHVWRNVPFQDVEDVANDAHPVLAALPVNPWRELLLQPADQEALDVRDLEGLFGTPDEIKSMDGPDPVVTGAMLILAAGDGAPIGEQPPPLVRPGRITDDFLKDLARTYRWLIASGHNAPATAIAEESGAPVATVRRWIVNARQRGFLPPGRPGRAG